MFFKSQGVRIFNTQAHNINYKNNGLKRNDNKCSHYGGNENLKESCFKIIGYPNWYKQSKNQRGNKS